MKPKTMILMVVAIVCGLGASYMTSRLLAERDDKPQQETPQEIPKVKILVAKTNLDHGAAIKNPQEMFVEKTIPQEGAPKDALTDTKNTPDQDGKAMPASVVTLALKQIDAMKIDLAKRHGSLSFVVRRLGDTTPPPESEVYTDKDLFSSKLDLKKNRKSPGDKDNA